MKKIGIIGGNGTIATLDFICELVNNTLSTGDSDRPSFILYNLPPEKDDTFVYDGNLRKYSPLNSLISAGKYIENGGADVLVVPCNSLHYFHEYVQRELKIKFLSIIEVTVEKIVRSYPNVKNVVVLATSVTIENELYKRELERRGLSQVILPSKIQNTLMKCLFDGDCKELVIKNSKMMQNVFDYIKKETNAEIVIAGCTEVPLFIDHVSTLLPIINSTLELARAALKYTKYPLMDKGMKIKNNFNEHYAKDSSVTIFND